MSTAARSPRPFSTPPGSPAIKRGRLRANLPPFRARAFLILSGRLNAVGTTVERRAFGIARRAISTMVTAAAYNEAIRIYHITQRDSIDDNLAYIGRDFTEVRPEGFDTRYMRALFDYAYGKSSNAYDWLKEPSILWRAGSIEVADGGLRRRKFF